MNPGVRPTNGADRFRAALSRAVGRRERLASSGVTDAWRVFAGAGDGWDGVFIDRYGPGAVLMLYEGTDADALETAETARVTLEMLAPLGVTAVYAKPFARDRSKLGGVHPSAMSDPTPAAGSPLPESVVLHEHGCALEVRLWDGFSTGLFLDQRENRRHLASLCAAKPGIRVLNTFAYTCGFSVACARAGAVTASVDVSGRYLEWGKRNFAHNGIDIAPHRFARMDTFEFLEYAERKGLWFDLVILDPPSFASADKRRGIRAWSSVADYAKLVAAATRRLDPRGERLLFASTNTLELCRAGRLEREIENGLAREPRWLELPPAGVDFAAEKGRFAARLCRVG